jgi:hypothetical protein
MLEENKLAIVKRLLRAWRLLGATGGLLCLACGCETFHDYSLSYKVWGNDEFSRWSEPLPDPRLALLETPDSKKLLVAYDAFSEKHSVTNRQAYYLQPNQARIGAGKAPRLVQPKAIEGMKPIPVFAQNAFATNSPPGLAHYAVVSETGRDFTLYSQTEPPRALQLPVYRETSGTAKRVALTPFAVVGDTAMVGLVASGVALWIACESGLTFTP